jgi:hypothetical protein
MNDQHRLNPHHAALRPVLRTLGPALVVVGLIFIGVGMASFFSSFGSFEPPRYFWCAFVGMPLLAVGVAMTKFAYLGAVSRYVAGETAPVAKDTFSYLADGTTDSVKALAAAAAQGISTGFHEGETVVACPRCEHKNDADANFCEQCGASLSRICPECQKPNEAQARYCDNCGQDLVSGQ